MNSSIRVRFAPSPTGFMHLGNVRTALINYLFARHYKGTFIIRIEDTDQQRMFDARAQEILKDLAWLSLSFQEGPEIGGPHEPYYQSERNNHYQQYLAYCIAQHSVYRCFCTTEELEKKRERQIAQKLPPRYDRTCLLLDAHAAQAQADAGKAFIWRFKLPDTVVTINDLARGPIAYDLKHFSDFAITRQDGSSTFIFANFVDDVLMEITHVIRGEDHLSNTANQAALYTVLKKELPLFWHLPIITNTQGKKLSKRDFGFSLNDLRQAGYLPEAINNYLALLGTSAKNGADFDEIMSLDQISNVYDFDHISSTGQIKYDIEKLRWINQKWIQKISFEDFKNRVKHLISLPDNEHVDALLQSIKPELMTLNDIVEKTNFYVKAPVYDIKLLPESEQHAVPFLVDYIQTTEHVPSTPEALIQSLVQKASLQGIKTKTLYCLLRLLLTGHTHGLSVKDIITFLGIQESYKRFSRILSE